MKSKIEATRNSLILSAYKTYGLDPKDIAKIFRASTAEIRVVIKARTRLDDEVKYNGN